jgi:predicted short-subunit dehydrogenase-like oxidoreductase (DUF2520 family)
VSAGRPPTALIGAGRLASALGPGLARAGYPIVAVASRRGRTARVLCRRIGQGFATSDAVRAADTAQLVLLAVPDREIAKVTRRLAEGLGSLRGRTVIHHAGALGTEPLEPAAQAGAAVAVLHPLQCLGPSAAAARLEPGSRARIEGVGRGPAVARRLARDLGLLPLRLPEVPSRADRELYHAAASLAANDLVGLLDLAARLLERLGLRRSAATGALLPLMKSALALAERGPLGLALTGPVARADVHTLASHLARLARSCPRAAGVHRLLSRQLIEVAAGRLSPAQRAGLRRLVAEP